jgi:integrase/recombinase XerC
MNLNILDQFAVNLTKQDLAPRTIQCYIYDLNNFALWIENFYQQKLDLIKVTSNDIRAYREYLIKLKRHKVASVNRRIQSIKRFYNWIIPLSPSNMNEHPTNTIKFMRRGKVSKPCALSKREINDLLRVTGRSSHGLAKRNYAIIQLMLQAGLRIGEVAQLQNRDLVLQERSGSVKIVDGKGHRSREVPLNATVRRALKSYLDARGAIMPEDPVFISKRGTAQTIRGLQKIIQTLVIQANIERIKASAHTLRHTFAVNYLAANPGALVQLAALMGHESINTTALYTQPSSQDLNESVERSELNLFDVG